MEAIKYIMFYAMEAAVVGLVMTVLVAGVYQIVRDAIADSRAKDSIPTR